MKSHTNTNIAIYIYIYIIIYIYIYILIIESDRATVLNNERLCQNAAIILHYNKKHINSKTKQYSQYKLKDRL